MRYVSTGLDGKPIEVSGVVIAPRSAGKDRPVVGYAYGTQGIAAKCTASERDPHFKLAPGIPALAARGFVVAATDYPGLGSAGMHPYLVGISEGRAVLDSVRAARHIAAAGASARFIPWGYSQGGHSALFAGQLTAGYAPELHLAGIAAGAPPTDLHETVKFHVEQNGNRMLAAYLLASWSNVYGFPLGNMLDGRAIRAVRLAANTCLTTKTDAAVAALHTVHLGSGFLNRRLLENEAWNKRFKENTPGIVGAVPYLILQGQSDRIVPPRETHRYVERLCANGNRVEYMTLPAMNHITAAVPAEQRATAWIADRFANKPPPSNCTPAKPPMR